MPLLRVRQLIVAAMLSAYAAAGAAQIQVDPSRDVLIFKDGDRLSGTLVRAERGSLVFRSAKAGESNVGFEHVEELICNRLFAVLPNGARVTKKNAIIGKLELFEGTLIITPATGVPYTLRAADVAYAIEDTTFEREVSRKTPLYEGIEITASVGGSLVRSTETGSAITASGHFVRAIPGVDYLPRRNRTEFSIKDSYEEITTPDSGGGPSTRSETHVLHAEFERNEYIHAHFYVLADYSFDRDFAQGLLSQELIGGGLGVTVVDNSMQKFDVKTDVHRATQGFNDPADNVTLIGQKITLDYERELPGGVRFHELADYLPAYNLPHKYSANSTTTVTVPIYRSLGITFEATDNYLNDALPSLRPNTFRFSTSLTYTKQR